MNNQRQLPQSNAMLDSYMSRKTRTGHLNNDTPVVDLFTSCQDSATSIPVSSTSCQNSARSIQIFSTSFQDPATSIPVIYTLCQDFLPSTSIRVKPNKFSFMLANHLELATKSSDQVFYALLDTGVFISAIAKNTFNILQQNLPNGQSLNLLPVNDVTVSTALRSKSNISIISVFFYC